MEFVMTGQNAKSGRRNFLKVLGGGVILAAGAGSLFAFTRTPTKAIEPWKLALGPQSDADPRRIILSHAILAPNPHNRQPWVVDLEKEDEITLYCDLDKRLPHTDPYDRQITIGLGCFLELAVMTAKEIGMRSELTLFPEGENFPRLDQRPVARIRLQKDASVKPDPLFAQILERRSNKEGFDVSRKVQELDAFNIIAVAERNLLTGSVMQSAKVEEMRKLTREALLVEMHTYRTNKESIDLMRMGKAEIEANPDGIDMGGLFLETLGLLGQLERDDLVNPESAAFKNGIPIILEPLETAMGYVFIKTQANTRKDQIEAGRGYVRMNLKATALGIAMHPLSQALQEYEEVKPQFEAIKQKLDVKPQETLQMFARIGYGEKPNPSPRWNYEAKIRSS
jgi:hypothetical protein